MELLYITRGAGIQKISMDILKISIHLPEYTEFPSFRWHQVEENILRQYLKRVYLQTTHWTHTYSFWIFPNPVIRNRSSRRHSHWLQNKYGSMVVQN